jgi:hypothetical protein
MLTACGSSRDIRTDAEWSDARLRGQIDPSSTAPDEVRVLLDPSYRRDNCGGDNVIEGYAEPGLRFSRAEVDESSAFASKPFVVSCKRRLFRQLAEPTFFVSFANEQDTFYAIGNQAGALQWRTYDMQTKEIVSRENACWRVVAASYYRPSRKSIELNIILRENPSSPKECREGVF